MAIKMDELKIGDRVIYEPYRGATRERGVVVRVASDYVFVRYGDDQGVKATRPRDLMREVRALLEDSDDDG